MYYKDEDCIHIGDKDYIQEIALRRRGWTRNNIKKWLIEPDITIPQRQCTPTNGNVIKRVLRFYSKTKVDNVINDTTFQYCWKYSKKRTKIAKVREQAKKKNK
jgi:hypothetical protein